MKPFRKYLAKLFVEIPILDKTLCDAAGNRRITVSPSNYPSKKYLFKDFEE